MMVVVGLDGAACGGGAAVGCVPSLVPFPEAARGKGDALESALLIHS